MSKMQRFKEQLSKSCQCVTLCPKKAKREQVALFCTGSSWISRLLSKLSLVSCLDTVMRSTAMLARRIPKGRLCRSTMIPSIPKAVLPFARNFASARSERQGIKVGHLFIGLAVLGSLVYLCLFHLSLSSVCF